MAIPAYEDLFTTLNDRELAVIAHRFGLVNGRECTLQEVGDILGVTHERIRRIEGKALRKLQTRAARLRITFSDFFG